jgi:multiple sugar transport system substrate-binding protein
MDNRIYGNFCRLMKIFSMTFAAGLLGINVQAKTIQLTMQHMEQPPSRVEAMQVVVDKFNAKYPQYRMKQNVVGWGEAYSRVSAQVEAGVGVDLQQAIPAFFTAIS